jgi:hypothetical protein
VAGYYSATQQHNCRRSTGRLSHRRAHTLEAILSQLHGTFSPKSAGALEQAKELIGFLEKYKSILAIDDYHLLQKGAILPLVKAAAYRAGSVKLLLITKVFPDELSELAEVEILSITSFNDKQTQNLIDARGISLHNEITVHRLIQKTGGLPFAISLFCSLVRFGLSPDDLLNGELEGLD